ncbi:gliding motility-associated C-terminal domain-containing protein [Dyadobacter psychrotolerans]|uniref:Gliding motility-associated C-terminal domain-containing protein n=1 Tax=Dyadobacter psychrotolerans TaxID=2541721 RepID=A0A4R5DZW5_9BACT|nr:gliding motility-associated C-terminal domain-containing protein [Dyadobacter psychrotolerans]TDE17761.1 gliding motility-associated C-terminal domain-containing protein [Dyadobacter psychrotolerans]
MLRYLLLFFLFLKSTFLLANHIVGGELKMKPTAANTFEISLIQYWDKKNLTIPTGNTGGNRDPDADVYIYNKRTHQLTDMVKVTLRSTSDIEYQNKACATSRSMSTVIGIYTGSIYLDPQKYVEPEGYYVVWERCCRNSDINNIVDPGAAGMVFYLEFPPVALRNTSPEFQLPNGQYICNKKGFTMNMSAVDADGDELRYSLVTPMNGYTTTGNAKGNSSSKATYPLITWASGVSISNVIPGSSPLAVDKNGILKVTSEFTGLYVFAIQIEEYRNGKKIGLVRRDFQLLVIDCNDERPEQPIVMFNAQPVTEVKFCPEKPIQLETSSAQDWFYQWQLNGLNIPGATDSRITVKDTGSYSVVKSFSKKCSRDTSSTIIRVSYSKPPEAVITVEKSVLCRDEKTRLLANGGTPSPGLNFSWKLDNALFGGNDPIITADKPGLYNLVITETSLGCTGQDTASVHLELISVTLPEKASLIESRKMTLTPEISPPDLTYTYSWMPDEGLAVNTLISPAIDVAPLQPTNYTIEITSSNGCKADATIQINVIDKMHIPSAFSPNNDGINDTFEIFNAKGQIETLRIYNRWGEVIYSSTGYDVPWNGTSHDEPVPPGIYPYTIKASGETFRGEILLLR